MARFRGSSIIVATVILATMAAGCTGGGSGEPDGSESSSPAAASGPPTGTPGRPTPDEPTADPLSPLSPPATLRAAAGHAVAALDVRYPEVSVDILDAPYDELYKLQDLDEQHGLVERVRVDATTSLHNPFWLAFWLQAFPDASRARAFQADLIEQFSDYRFRPVEVPGWPEPAIFWRQEIMYSFVDGPAVGFLSLRTTQFDGEGAAGEELGAVLDIVTANLTLP